MTSAVELVQISDYSSFYLYLLQLDHSAMSL